jgi:hypothetical protein
LLSEKGVLPSQAIRVNFLAGLGTDRYWSEKGEAQKLNAIWYTFREDPDLIYT